MEENQEISLRSFLICRDVLENQRNSNVISIINIFNELRVSKFPAELGSICLVSIYGGAPGKHTHHFELWCRGEHVGGTDDAEFFLEDSISSFHVVSYMDGVLCDEPQQFTFKSIINGEEMGVASLGVFRPLLNED